VEDVRPDTRAWTVLVHQVFANLLETGGCTMGDVLSRTRFVPSFAGLADDEIRGLITHLVKMGWVEQVDGLLVVGRLAEQAFGARNFFKLYAVFDSPEALTVRHGSQEIGTLQTWFAIQLSGPRKCFRLAGRGWEVKDLDLKRRTVSVVPAAGGVVPSWTGRPGAYSTRVCETIRDLLVETDVPAGCDDTAGAWLAHVRGLVEHLRLEDLRRRPVERREDHTTWHTFAGARVNLVLGRWVTAELGLACTASNLALRIKSTDAGLGGRVRELLARLRAEGVSQDDEWAEIDSERRQHLLSQFQHCLPPEAEQEWLRRQLFDVDGALRWVHRDLAHLDVTAS
jgi:ATP-dependent Lhr-like helicase